MRAESLPQAPIGGDWRAIFAFPKPPDGHRGGALFPIEHERWLVTLGGNGGDYPPNDEQGFMAFARSLRTPLLYEAIRDAVPVSGITAYRRTENRLRHYEALRSWPEGFIVTGDAACCFNPVYGQGMTVAGQDALVLRRWLVDEASTQEFQRRLAKSLATPWILATSEDFRYPTTIGGATEPSNPADAQVPRSRERRRRFRPSRRTRIHAGAPHGRATLGALPPRGVVRTLRSPASD